MRTALPMLAAVAWRAAQLQLTVAHTRSLKNASSTQHAAQLLDGSAVAEKLRLEIQQEVAQLSKIGLKPGLAMVVVGARTDSQTYVRKKQAACEEVGFANFGVNLNESASELEVLKAVHTFNQDPRVHGILVQLPLPAHIDQRRIQDAISVNKDVDGFHTLNMGRLATKGQQPLFAPCTPLGCIELLDRYSIPIAGKHAVVMGRSSTVGLPLSLMLLARDATVMVVHSRTTDPAELASGADLLFTACGKAELVDGAWVKQGAVVVDVGINSVAAPGTRRGYQLVGDVRFDEVAAKASWITPVPGGVGPMTIAMLLRNTLRSAQSHVR